MPPLSRTARTGLALLAALVATCTVASAWSLATVLDSDHGPTRIVQTPEPVGAVTVPDARGA